VNGVSLNFYLVSSAELIFVDTGKRKGRGRDSSIFWVMIFRFCEGLRPVVTLLFFRLSSIHPFHIIISRSRDW